MAITRAAWLLAFGLTFTTGLSAQAPPVNSTAGPSDVLTPANLDRLKTITQSASKTSNLDAPVVKMLGLGKEGETVTVKQFRAETAIGLFVFTLPVKPASDNVVFSFRDLSGVTYSYLSDSTRTLKAAMASDADGNRMLTNEEAADGFRNSLIQWARIARTTKFP